MGPGARSRWHLSARARRSRSITGVPGDAAKAVVGESEAEGVWAITCGARTSLISMLGWPLHGRRQNRLRRFLDRRTLRFIADRRVTYRLRLARLSSHWRTPYWRAVKR